MIGLIKLFLAVQLLRIAVFCIDLSNRLSKHENHRTARRPC